MSVETVPDVLGAPYVRRDITLPDDAEGPVVATLVTRRAEQPTNAAVLYVHGWVDYFFQTHLADFFVAAGIDFYALDLRKYGRSLRAHQTPNHCHSLTEYYAEIDEAVRIIREEDGHDRLLINGHSTGGLIAALWGHDRRADGRYEAMILNSPFFDFPATGVTKSVVLPAAAALGARRPLAALKLPENLVYGHSIHKDHHGEWDYDLAWKPIKPFPVFAGWLRAVLAGHKRVHEGLDITAPVLVGCSTASYKLARWDTAATTSDSVLHVDHIARWTPAVGRNVTLVRVDKALHDLVLSPEPVREQFFAAMRTWMGAYFPTTTRQAPPVPPSGALLQRTASPQG